MRVQRISPTEKPCVCAQPGDGFTSASSPTRSLTLGRWGCGERTIQSLSWQRLQLVNQRQYARHISLSCHLCLQELEQHTRKTAGSSVPLSGFQSYLGWMAARGRCKNTHHREETWSRLVTVNVNNILFCLTSCYVRRCSSMFIDRDECKKHTHIMQA